MTEDSKKLFDYLNANYKPNKAKPELGEFTELKYFGNDKKVYFSINWDTVFEIKFNPKTIKVSYTKIDKDTKGRKTSTKQYPLDQDNLVEEILSLAS